MNTVARTPGKRAGAAGLINWNREEKTAPAGAVCHGSGLQASHPESLFLLRSWRRCSRCGRCRRGFGLLGGLVRSRGRWRGGGGRCFTTHRCHGVPFPFLHDVERDRTVLEVALLVERNGTRHALAAH